MKVFLDTNVWLSAVVFPGLCAEILAGLYESDHDVLTSRLVRDEAIEVLRRKFVRHGQAVTNFNRLWGQVICVEDVAAPAEDADERLVIAASNAGADLFVTGDRRVLDWGQRAAMHIASPRDAWQRLFI